MNTRSPQNEGRQTPPNRREAGRASDDSPPGVSASLTRAATSIRGIVSDVDGVMTDGSIWYGEDGSEWKRFHVRDGLAIKHWIAAGNCFGVITARGGSSVRRRMAELGVGELVENSSDKRQDFHTMIHRWGLTAAQTAFVGDDLADALSMIDSGLGVAPEDACDDVLGLADVTLAVRGGEGVLRSLIETLMRASGTWPTPIAATGDPTGSPPTATNPTATNPPATTPKRVD